MSRQIPYTKCDAILEILESEGRDLLVRFGEDNKAATRGAKEFALSVLTHFGGLKFYFPKFTVDAARKKQKSIREDAQENRLSAVELAKFPCLLHTRFSSKPPTSLTIVEKTTMWSKVSR